ncbi:MAG: uracil-DNA glycosylase [Desulfobacterota bacterium]|nr:uracil-DNA glycosylase [Thermodesulfobacteriota bacterium]
MNPLFYETISDLKAYFQYLKGLGVNELVLPGTIDPLRPSCEAPRDTGRKDLPPPSRSSTAKRIGLSEIRSELGDCRRCPLHRTRKTIVFGEGNEQARLMLIGEGPGYEEDVQGRPFVGKAGQLLTRILQAIQLQREEVYITNIVKCRPPQNRNPEPEEVEACSPFLWKQIQAIRPKVICALGTVSAQTLLRTDAKITALRGRSFEVSGIPVFPTYHPAYLLRNPDKKREVWEDMKRIAQALAGAER